MSINLRNYFNGLITYRQLEKWADSPFCDDEEVIAYVNDVRNY